MKRTILFLFLLFAFNLMNAQSYFTSSFGLQGEDHVGSKMYHINETLNNITGYSSEKMVIQKAPYTLYN